MIERLAPLKVGAFIDRTLGVEVFDSSYLHVNRYPSTNSDGDTRPDEHPGTDRNAGAN